MKITVVGAGYVGIHSIYNLTMSKENYEVVAYDISVEKVSKFNSGVDCTDELGDDKIKELLSAGTKFTTDANDIANSDIYIIAVPTDAISAEELYYLPLEKASSTVAEKMKHGSIVVYESTVYPGLTEEICIPLLLEHSGLKLVDDFNVIYTPERVDPGNKVNTVFNTPRVISGTNDEAIKTVVSIYEEYIQNMVIVSSIKVAESIKILENTQRDVNIALMNNFTLLMDKIDVDMDEVLRGASTKWNFLNFTPGLVGGHCIGVDPYYLIKKMNDENVDSSFISSAREISDYMLEFIEKKVLDVNPTKILYVGASFKPNTNDIRNSKHIELINKLKNKAVVDVYDPLADYRDKIEKVDILEYDTIIFGVKHNDVTYDFINDVTDQCVFNLVRDNHISSSQWNLI